MSENVATFIAFAPSELNGESIYNIIHTADHARFSSSLLPMAVSSPWSNSSSTSQHDNQMASSLSPIPSTTSSATIQGQGLQIPSTSQSSNSNLSVPTPTTPIAGQGPPPKQQQQRSFNIRLLTKGQTYENMQISSILTPHPGLEENCLVCIARRLPPNERAPGQAPVQQFTTKLLTDGRLVGVDTSGLGGMYKSYIGKVC